MLIAISGIDGSGKTTLANAVSTRLGCPMISFPDRSTATGREISAMLKGEIPHSPMAFQALQVCNRLEHLAELRKASRNATQHLVCDRYTVDGLVYGSLDGLRLADVARIQASLPEPDLVVLLDVSEDDARRRLEARGGPREHYESKKMGVQCTLATRFREVWRANGAVPRRGGPVAWPYWAVVTGSGNEDADDVVGMLNSLTRML